MEMLPIIFVGVGLALVGIAVYRWDQRRREALPGRGTKLSLFSELCDAHDLSKSERALLTETVQARSLDQPAAVFTNPAILIEHLKSGADEVRARKALLVKLFGDALTNPKPQDAPADDGSQPK